MNREEILLRRIKLKRQLITLIHDEIELLREEYQSIGDVAGKLFKREATLREMRDEEILDDRPYGGL